MKSLLKACVIVAGILLILMAVVALLLGGTLTGPLKRELESQLAKLLSGPVQIERISFSPRDRALYLHGFATNAPEQGLPFLECSRVVIVPDFSSLLSEKITIKTVILEDAAVRLGDGAKLSNPLGYIQNLVAGSQLQIAGKSIQVNRLEFEGGSVNWEGKQRNVTLPCPSPAPEASPKAEAPESLESLLGTF